MVGNFTTLPASPRRLPLLLAIGLLAAATHARTDDAALPVEAIVRIRAIETAAESGFGSGTIVLWNARIVVLTARHVVADAKKIIVETRIGGARKSYWARTLMVDPIWDCAVLELVDAPKTLPTAVVQRGAAAKIRPGERLRSCGYGQAGQFLLNHGEFHAYRRSQQRPNGPDDWLEMSGPSRPGDSGGPIFNDRGAVAGVLWGTDGRVTLGVQAGRLHLLLDAAAPPLK